MNTIAERVAAGAVLLDQVRPGWREELNLATLDVASPFRCPLSQLYGGYTHAVMVLSGRDIYEVGSWASVHGFDVGEIEEDDDAEYEALTAAWKAEASR